MEKDLGLDSGNVEPGLAKVLVTVAAIVAEIASILRNQDATGATDMAGTTNAFGDKQLKLDMRIDDLVFERLASCPACCAASSEERPEMRELSGSGYTVVFDPLDGSSIVGANFAVGSIFGIYPGKGVVGRTGREQVAAAYAVYGPRTVLVWARPGISNSSSPVVQQFVLSPKGVWQMVPQAPVAGAQQPAGASCSADGSSQGAAAGGAQQEGPSSSGRCDAPTSTTQQQQPLIGQGKRLFAPANLRCAAGNKVYADLVAAWIEQGFTLRYTGGMVPDVHHIIAKGGGVFVNPASPAAPAKLRLVYECAPLAFIIEAAGGSSHDGRGSLLDSPITSTAQRSLICLGSRDLVAASEPAMRASLEAAAHPAS